MERSFQSKIARITLTLMLQLIRADWKSLPSRSFHVCCALLHYSPGTTTDCLRWPNLQMVAVYVGYRATLAILFHNKIRDAMLRIFCSQTYSSCPSGRNHSQSGSH